MITINEQIVTFRKQLKSKLDTMRYEHSVSVSYTCIALAMRYGFSLEKAELAGLLHDCAKCIPNKKKLKADCPMSETRTVSDRI